MSEIAVLCVRANSVYQRIPGLDLYDAERNALTFRGGMPVIAHPPCRLWGRLAHFARSADEEAEKAISIFCAAMVKRWGGVLEHPAHSKLWKVAGLPTPLQTTRGTDGWTLQVPQFWFGHRGLKETWLYIQGVRSFDLPVMSYRMPGADVRPVEDLCKAERERTPEPMARWLVEVARRAVVDKELATV